MKVYAVIPARSGSKGLPDKNIKLISGKPLMAYSIDFARSCDFIDRVFCSTDSEEYARIAIEHGAEVPFLRSAEAATDTSMEEHILDDLRKKFEQHGISEPDIMVWLRPTFVFRSEDDVRYCVDFLKANPDYSAARTVALAESRLYRLANGRLQANFKDEEKSMVRRQDVIPQYKVFSTDVFWFRKNELGPRFLGQNIHGRVIGEPYSLDIDTALDFEIVRMLIEHGVIEISRI